MKKAVLATILACVTMFCACGMLPEEQTFTQSVLIQEEEIEYSFVNAVRGTLAHTEKIVCSYMPAAKEEYSFAIGGETFGGIYVKYGDEVSKGDLLAELDVDDLQVSVLQLKAELEQCELTIAKLNEEKAIAVRKQEVLLQSQSASEQAMMESTESIAGRYEMLVAQEQTKLEIGSVELERLNSEIEDRRIYAGMDGIVSYVKKISASTKSVENGTVVTVSDKSASFFTAQTKYAADMTVGESYTISLDKGNYELLIIDPAQYGITAQEGKAYFLAPAGTTELSDGDKGTILVTLEQMEDVIYLPEAAVSRLDDKSVIFYLNEEGIRTYKEVITGFSASGYVEILEGVVEGESVIIG